MAKGPGRYVKVAVRIWRDEKFRTLSDEEQFLYIYILTSPHSNMAGYFVLPDMYIMEDLGWAKETVTQTLSKLLGKGLINRCETTSVTLLENYFRYNPIQNPNQAKGVINKVKELPKNSLVEDFISACEAHAGGRFDGLDFDWKKELRNSLGTVGGTPSEGLGKGSETVSKPETEAVTETEIKSTASARACAREGEGENEDEGSNQKSQNSGCGKGEKEENPTTPKSSLETIDQEATKKIEAAFQKHFGGVNLHQINLVIDDYIHGHDMEPAVVEEAMRRSTVNGAQNKFRYTTSILDSWANKKVTTLDDVTREDDEHKQSKTEEYPYFSLSGGA